MNFFREQQLRIDLKKQKESHLAQLNLLTNSSTDVSNYLALEAQKEQLEQELQQIKADLVIKDQEITNLQVEIQTREQTIANKDTDLVTVKQTKQQEISIVQKDLRDYQLYHQRELRRIEQEKQATVKQKTAALTKTNEALLILANHRLELLEQEKSALITLAKKKITNKKEAKELLQQLQTSWEAEKQDLEQRIAALEADKAELIAQNQQQTTTIEELSTKVQTAKQEQQKLTEQVIGLKEQTVSLTQQITSLTEQQLTLESQHAQQLQKLLAGSQLFLSKQQQKQAELIAQLELAQQKNQDNAVYQQYLQADLKRLAKSQKELTKVIKQLQESETANKLQYEQELAQLIEAKQNKEAELIQTQQQLAVLEEQKIISWNLNSQFKVTNSDNASYHQMSHLDDYLVTDTQIGRITTLNQLGIFGFDHNLSIEHYQSQKWDRTNQFLAQQKDLTFLTSPAALPLDLTHNLNLEYLLHPAPVKLDLTHNKKLKLLWARDSVRLASPVAEWDLTHSEITEAVIEDCHPQEYAQAAGSLGILHRNQVGENTPTLLTEQLANRVFISQQFSDGLCHGVVLKRMAGRSERKPGVAAGFYSIHDVVAETQTPPCTKFILKLAEGTIWEWTKSAGWTKRSLES